MKGILFRLVPPSASDFAGKVDAIFLVWCLIAACFVLLIAGLIVFFMIRYRRSARKAPPAWQETYIPIEIVWTLIPLGITLTMFAWGATEFLHQFSEPPKDTYEIMVLGKQWMWKFEHPDGRRELNDLHIAVGKPVRLLMVSQDVIHDVFIPAFRIKHDVLPMKYTSMWFLPTKVGTYHLFCSQYCGTNHSEMGARVHVLEPNEFQSWMASTQGMGSPASEGKALLEVLGCRSCHHIDSMAVAPRLEGLYGGPVQLDDGSVVTANEDYVRDIILDPMSHIVAHYQPVMPSFRGRVTEEQILQIISFLKSVPYRTEGGSP